MSREETLDALALALTPDDGEVDHLEVVERLKPILGREAFVGLCAKLDVCPDHVCDIAICKDDGVHGDEVYDATPRRYMVAAFDITDLDEAERDSLSGEVWAQAERSDGHPSVGVTAGEIVEGQAPGFVGYFRHGDAERSTIIFAAAGIGEGVIPCSSESSSASA